MAVTWGIQDDDRIAASAMGVRFLESRDPGLAARALPMLSDMIRFYPGFDRWYHDKVMVDLAVGTGPMVAATFEGEIVGIGLGKRGADETKIRCVFVRPDWRRVGIGRRLFREVARMVGREHPSFTVCEELFRAASPMLLNDLGHVVTSVLVGAYRPGKLEYVFNGGEGVSCPR